MVSAPYMQPVIDRFRPVFEKHDLEIVLPEVHERMEETQLLEWVGDIDGAICGDDRFTERVMKAAPKLKVISKWGTGIDSIDQEAAARLGIAVCNTPGAFTHPVSDSVLGYILCFARKIPWMTQDIKAGRWTKIPGVSLRESCLGVIGVGDVGRAVIRRAAAFGMRILATDPVSPPQDFLDTSGVEMVSKTQLLQEADFVSLNCTLNQSSHHIISSAELKMMKSTAFLINTARGPLIDEDALVIGLQNDEIAGVGLDVFEVEPLPKDSLLRKMDNVLLAPHNSNSSPEAWERVHHNTIQNLVKVLNNA